MKWSRQNTQTAMLKMNAGEQSFNHMPFTKRLSRRTTSSISLDTKDYTRDHTTEM